MPTREEILEKQTFNEPSLGLVRRVFYTLTADKKAQADLTSKAVALLVEFLCEKGMMGASEVDDLLVNCVTAVPALPKSKPAAKGKAKRKGK